MTNLFLVSQSFFFACAKMAKLLMSHSRDMLVNIKLQSVISVFVAFGLFYSGLALAAERSIFVEPISLYGGMGAGLAVDSNDNLYIAETWNNQWISPNGPFVSNLNP